MTAPAPKTVTCGCGERADIETSGPPYFRDLRGEPRGWATLTLTTLPARSYVICARCVRAVRAILDSEPARP